MISLYGYLTASLGIALQVLTESGSTDINQLLPHYALASFAGTAVIGWFHYFFIHTLRHVLFLTKKLSNSCSFLIMNQDSTVQIVHSPIQYK